VNVFGGVGLTDSHPGRWLCAKMSAIISGNVFKNQGQSGVGDVGAVAGAVTCDPAQKGIPDQTGRIVSVVAWEQEFSAK